MRSSIRLYSLAILTSASLCQTPEALAQTVLGRSVIDGRTVEILSDQTWRYSDVERESGCTSFQFGLSFCDGSSVWQRTELDSADIAAQYRVDDRHYGQFVIEALGRKDGFSPEFMRRAVVENAAGAVGGDTTDVAVLDISDETLGAFSGETIKYHTDIDGLNVVFFNTVIIRESITYQLISFSINTEITDRHIELHEDLLSRIRIDGTE